MWTRLVGATILLLLLLACEALGPAAPSAEKAIPQPLTEARLLFLHRSVGGNLVRYGEPDMYGVLDQLNVDHGTANQLWHHFCGAPPYGDRYYDHQDQQVLPNFGPALSEPQSATPEYWSRVFCDDAPEYVAARDSIDNFRVIAVKCGYDNTVPYATDRCGQWRAHFNAMKDSEFFRDPRLRVVMLGFPPIREGMLGATQADADSARGFSQWLEEHWPRGRGNLFVFPLFDHMAGADNWLRDEYELDVPNDSHPNLLGSTEVGGALARFLHEVAMQKAPVDDDVRPDLNSLSNQRP